MDQRRENNSHEAREEKVGELGRAYAAAVLAGDEVAAELVIREAIESDLSVAEIITIAARHRPDVVCLSATMPGSSDQLLITMHEVQRAWPKASFVVGGRGVTSRMQVPPGVEICHRVSDAVDAVDALVQSARMN